MSLMRYESTRAQPGDQGEGECRTVSQTEGIQFHFKMLYLSPWGQQSWQATRYCVQKHRVKPFDRSQIMTGNRHECLNIGCLSVSIVSCPRQILIRQNSPYSADVWGDAEMRVSNPDAKVQSIKLINCNLPNINGKLPLFKNVEFKWNSNWLS